MSNNTSINEQNMAISYYLEEIENQEKEEINIEEFMAEIENSELTDDLAVTQMVNYRENFTVKELLLICDYYGFAKELKNNKCNKEQIIEILVSFESDLNLKKKYQFKKQEFKENLSNLFNNQDKKL